MDTHKVKTVYPPVSLSSLGGYDKTNLGTCFNVGSLVE